MKKPGEMPDDSSRMAAVLRPVGPLDLASVPELRQKILQELAADDCSGIVFEAHGITKIDGVGLGFLAELRSATLRKFNQEMVVKGIPDELARLIDVSGLNDQAIPLPGPRPKANPIEKLGKQIHLFASDAFLLISFLGELLSAAWRVVRSPARFRLREFLFIAQEVGADALPIVSLLGFLLGAILAFQTSVPLDRFGAISIVPTIIGVAILRELGPLIAAILVAGRSGAAFAAELGTMRVTEELSALRVMGLNPTRFLIVPRVAATVLMLPLLCVYTDFVGVLGGFAVMSSRGFSLAQYTESLRSGVELPDAVGGVIKTLAFGLLIAFAGCQRGINTGPGPGAVGRSTTKAVVSSIVLILIADVIFGFVFYVLRI